MSDPSNYYNCSKIENVSSNYTPSSQSICCTGHIEQNQDLKGEENIFKPPTGPAWCFDKMLNYCYLQDNLLSGIDLLKAGFMYFLSGSQISLP